MSIEQRRRNCRNRMVAIPIILFTGSEWWHKFYDGDHLVVDRKCYRGHVTTNSTKIQHLKIDDLTDTMCLVGHLWNALAEKGPVKKFVWSGSDCKSTVYFRQRSPWRFHGLGWFIRRIREKYSYLTTQVTLYKLTTRCREWVQYEELLSYKYRIKCNAHA